MSILKAPVKGYNGVSYGIRFIDGEGKTDDEFLISRLKKKGYSVVQPKVENEEPKVENEEPEVENEEPEVENEEPEVEENDISNLGYDELQAIAKELGIKANQSTEKLIEAITEAKK